MSVSNLFSLRITIKNINKIAKKITKRKKRKNKNSKPLINLFQYIIKRTLTFLKYIIIIIIIIIIYIIIMTTLILTLINILPN